MFTQVLCLYLFGVIVDVVKPGRPPLRSTVTRAVLWHQNGLFTPRAVNDSCFTVCCTIPNTPWHTSPPGTAVCLSMIFHSRGCCCCCAIIPSLNRLGGKKFGGNFLRTASLLLLILLIGSSMEITRGMIGSPGSRRLRGFSQPLILPP